jgi:hypothetical protein
VCAAVLACWLCVCVCAAVIASLLAVPLFAQHTPALLHNCVALSTPGRPRERPGREEGTDRERVGGREGGREGGGGRGRGREREGFDRPASERKSRKGTCRA